jgi:hypothetical protein
LTWNSKLTSQMRASTFVLAFASMAVAAPVAMPNDACKTSTYVTSKMHYTDSNQAFPSLGSALSGFGGNRAPAAGPGAFAGPRGPGIQVTGLGAFGNILNLPLGLASSLISAPVAAVEPIIGSVVSAPLGLLGIGNGPAPGLKIGGLQLGGGRGALAGLLGGSRGGN